MNLPSTIICGYFSPLLLCFVVNLFVAVLSSDDLTPYTLAHGSRLNHREIRECQEKEFGTAVHETYPSHHSWNLTSPFFEVKQFVKVLKHDFTSKLVRGHYAVVSNPIKTVSVLEPGFQGGCQANHRQTVTATARQRNCVVAVNAGYFNTKSGSCLGNVVSDGIKAHDSHGIQNAHFGIKSDGSLFTGYVSDEEFTKASSNFHQLVGGVIWIVRNGSNFVNASKFLECESTEETGTMDNFADIMSARTAIGHDEKGRVVIVHVDGKSSVDGVSLWEFQDLLKEFGLINAINSDGGGSSTFVVNDTVVNYPYDGCPLHDGFTCERNVSTIICVHPPDCEPSHCNDHGRCIDGICRCNTNWLPPDCSILFCSSNNCSGHGKCSKNGCVCDLGFHGENCEKVCPDGWYGLQCQSRCDCTCNSACDPKTGICSCQIGYTGANCSQMEEVKLKEIAETYRSSGHLKDWRNWNWTTVILSVVTALSLASSLLLVFYSCSCRCRNERTLCARRKRQKYRDLGKLSSNFNLSDSDSDSIPIRFSETGNG